MEADERTKRLERLLFQSFQIMVIERLVELDKLQFTVSDYQSAWREVGTLNFAVTLKPDDGIAANQLGACRAVQPHPANNGKWLVRPSFLRACHKKAERMRKRPESSDWPPECRHGVKGPCGECHADLRPQASPHS